LLPGYQYVHVPAQLYLDKDVWGRSEGPGKGSTQRDEEGPAIFSKWPILHSDYLLLSRNTSDEGDTHQRLCLHAVIDATAASSKGTTLGKQFLMDVYSIHLPLSEAARNRTVPELLAFIKESALGDIVMLTGDMNAEPQEPAMRALTAAGVILVSPPPAPTPSPVDSTVDQGTEVGMASTASNDEGKKGLNGVEKTSTTTATPSEVVGEVGRTEGAVEAEKGENKNTELELVPTPLPFLPLVLGRGGHPLRHPPLPLLELKASSDALNGELDIHTNTTSVGSSKMPDAPILCDSWRALYPEPARGDSDASARRFALTFPSDDPVKRIDMLLLGCGPGLKSGGEGMSDLDPTLLSHMQACSYQLASCGVRVTRTWTVGADPIPGTDLGDGKGYGMLSERSAWYASDHRGVVLEVSYG